MLCSERACMRARTSASGFMEAWTVGLCCGLNYVRLHSNPILNRRTPNDAPSTTADRQGRTSLHYAAGDSNAREVRRLLEAGADANLQDANGWSPLHFACQASSATCADALLRAGADVTLKDSYGNTALFRAVFASQGEGDVIMLLRRAGADPWSKNAHGVSPASLARSIANFNIAVHFADLGAGNS